MLIDLENPRRFFLINFSHWLMIHIYIYTYLIYIYIHMQNVLSTLGVNLFGMYCHRHLCNQIWNRLVMSTVSSNVQHTFSWFFSHSSSCKKNTSESHDAWRNFFGLLWRGQIDSWQLTDVVWFLIRCIWCRVFMLCRLILFPFSKDGIFHTSNFQGVPIRP